MECREERQSQELVRKPIPFVVDRRECQIRLEERDSETLMETMTRGRVYAHVEGDNLKSIVYFDNENKRSKQIDIDHPHKGEQPHTHHGYSHNENDSAKGAARLTPDERGMVDRVTDIWENRKRGK